MKAFVIKNYTDRITGQVRFSDTIVELTDERFGELSRKGYVITPQKAEPKVAKQPEPEPEPAPVVEPEPAPEVDFETMTKKQLKAYAQEHGIKVDAKATNAAIIAEIKAAL